MLTRCSAVGVAAWMAACFTLGQGVLAAPPRVRPAPATRPAVRAPAAPAVPAPPAPLTSVPLPAATLDDGSPEEVLVEILEGGLHAPKQTRWNFQTPPEATERYAERAFAFVGTPLKYSPKAIVVDRTNPFILRASRQLALPAGDYRLLVRARGATRLFVDGKLLADTPFVISFADGHEPVPELPRAQEPGLRPLPVGHAERLVKLKLDGRPHLFLLENVVGGDRLRLETGELCVAIVPDPPTADWPTFRLLAPTPTVELTDAAWSQFLTERQARLRRLDTLARQQRGADELAYWRMRHDQARAEIARRMPLAIPQISARLPVHNEIDRFLGERFDEAGVEPAPLADDEAFLRRVTLDVWGEIPSRAAVREHADEVAALGPRPAAEARAALRQRTIDRLLADPRWADGWMGYWQDVLAENPGIVKPVLNNTGPFRWWLHEALRDNRPADRFATELILMEGSLHGGAPAAFAVASENDAPMAAKAHTLAKAFLAVDLQCARCHDAPYQPFKQSELFGLASMLAETPLKLPASSALKPAADGRLPRVSFSLKPGEAVPAAWPFAAFAPGSVPAGALRATESGSTRAQLAALITSPANDRFAQVLANRLWKRYLGWGLVEPVDDWAAESASHPALLDWLARELATHDYDLKHVARLILSSHAYQRQVVPGGSSAPAARDRLFAGQTRRRMSAEQLVDSLFLAAGKPLGAEELNFDADGRRQVDFFTNLRRPERAWQFASLSNERDRPALALPVAQSILDLLATYGWRESRPNPITVREETATPLEPLVLANGIVGSRIARLSDDSALAQLCLEDRSLLGLIDAVSQQILSRRATDRERLIYVTLLESGFEERRIAPGRANLPASETARSAPRTMVSWSNHLSPEASRLKLELERAARAGDPPTARLNAEWRERMEDVVWAMINSPEFVFLP